MVSRNNLTYLKPVWGIVIVGTLILWLGGCTAREAVVTTVTLPASPTLPPSPSSTPTRLPAPVVIVTEAFEPATLTAVPINTATATASPFPSPTQTPVPPTETATVTPSPTSRPSSTPDPAQTAVPTPTVESWPTTNPTLLRRPPADIDVSRSHIWFSRPVDGNNSPSAPYRFGMTYNQRLSPHRAVDISNGPGTPVVAVGPGTVFYAGEDVETLFGPKADFYGRVVVVKMDSQWEGHTIYTLYGHLESVAVTTGQAVTFGDVLGGVGSAGVALGPHLHFEVRQDDPYDYGSVRNPELWYWPFTGRGVLAGRVVDAKGNFMPGTRVNLACSDDAPRIVETYWNQYTPPDDALVENFVISDLPAGVCRVWADLFGTVVHQFVEIRAEELTVVVLQARP